MGKDAIALVAHNLVPQRLADSASELTGERGKDFLRGSKICTRES